MKLLSPVSFSQGNVNLRPVVLKLGLTGVVQDSSLWDFLTLMIKALR